MNKSKIKIVFNVVIGCLLVVLIYQNIVILNSIDENNNSKLLEQKIVTLQNENYRLKEEIIDLKKYVGVKKQYNRSEPILEQVEIIDPEQ